MCTSLVRLAVTEEHAACLGMLAMPTLKHDDNNNCNKFAFQLMMS